jgi:hypothetical protein
MVKIGRVITTSLVACAMGCGSSAAPSVPQAAPAQAAPAEASPQVPAPDHELVALRAETRGIVEDLTDVTERMRSTVGMLPAAVTPQDHRIAAGQLGELAQKITAVSTRLGLAKQRAEALSAQPNDESRRLADFDEPLRRLAMTLAGGIAQLSNEIRKEAPHDKIKDKSGAGAIERNKLNKLAAAWEKEAKRGQAAIDAFLESNGEELFAAHLHWYEGESEATSSP